MPRKKMIDTKKLIKAVESDLSSKEIMSEFEIKNSAQLKSLYLDALIKERNVKGITDGRLKKRQARNEIKVNQRGSLIIPGEMVKRMGYKVGNTLVVRKTKSGVSMKKT
ncbi:MAG: hypothetical protein JRG97_11525 [Deltaproteobacteria bacterium]|nr:hypothetical protein [Deltaproteobacteria bacterium]MBW2052895.1 hypothetical protein [Deltaproteobacteria bacterium]MBW2141682.1 hypothetical protein [Deltaproteobacteria bacterium]MBW2323833.1 hypothetical protein [Deltaproteobacteria bacterium]